ncbi:chemotaxis protein CheA [Candidatus Marinarcus aquaticus]|uniref:Chemotaxis protein CheA n=1 Tax=Candidatus Marinarcus aquaticus TaxID=2044504 RepID=A0A4V1LP74_9BACT|nr:chemotaxis protein CheA [Candidatus Marinarcus aquaticus]RXJ60208.1 chemotaxis protein CheA [Candidatus Marinarcus aquaticus]
MSSFDISKYREMFLEEAVELFESANNVLLEAESNGSLTEDEMGQLFRDVHTLKGSGASVELALFAEFTHDVENMMDKLRNHQIEFQVEMVDTLIDALDVMKELLELEVAEELTRETFTEMTEGLLSDIRNYINGGGAPVEESATPEVAEASMMDESEETAPASAGGSFQSETYGFFDEAGASSSTNDFDGEAYFESQPYGFFDESFLEDENSNFGFFDEELQNSAFGRKEAKRVQQEQTDGSGFFDGVGPVDPNAKIERLNATIKEKAAQQASAPAEKPTAGAPAGAAARKRPERNADKKPAAATTNNIRVNLDKIDLLMNNVGDLVITNAMLTQFTTTIEDTKTRVSVLERLELLERHIRDMQDSIMSIRMVPMESIYSKFPKVVRDISKKLGKKVEFKHFGDNVEIDKAMIEGLTDPLMHIIRNSLDHGLETPDERTASGKDETGAIIISAEQANGQMIITIEDNGRGINSEKVAQKALENGQIDDNQFASMTENDKAMLIFGAGVTTAEQITDISGRGVGMDVVKTNIQKLGGAIKLDTELGRGTTITIVLPLTLAILDGLDIAVGEHKYILPLSSIVESLQPTEDMIKKIGDGTQDLLMLREEFIPVVKVHQLFGIEPKYHDIEDGMLIVVKSGNMKVALFIDEFLHQHQVVVKPLDKNYRSVEGIGAATVRGDGSIGLILDILGIINAQKKVERSTIEAAAKAS